jgi:hypothetical protein
VLERKNASGRSLEKVRICNIIESDGISNCNWQFYLYNKNHMIKHIIDSVIHQKRQDKTTDYI